jgi:hypothetical protein
VSTPVVVGFLGAPTEIFLPVYVGALEGMEIVWGYDVEKGIHPLGVQTNGEER